MRIGVLLLVALACGVPLPSPLPRVEVTSPAGIVAPDTASVEVTFSEPLDAHGIEDGRFFALCRREELRDVLRAAESEEGIGAGAPVVAARGTLADGGRRAVLRPAAPLEELKPWAAVLSHRVRSAGGRPVLDRDGKARSVVILFETGSQVDRAPPRGRWILPPHGPVPANVAELRIGFDEPVEGVLALPPGASARAGEPITLAADVVGLRLPALLTAGALALDATAVHDAAGNAAAPIAPVAVSACRAERPPELAGPLQATPARLGVGVEGALRGMGRLVAELSVVAGEACGAAPASPRTSLVRGEIAPCPGWDPCDPEARICPASLTLEGLCPGRSLRLRVASEDLAGNRGGWLAELDVAAQPPQPVPVVTEVLADADAPEAGGEYVEIANLGTGDLELAGLVLAKRTAAGKLVRCAIEGSAGRVVAPGAHALVVGGAYDGRYALPPGTVTCRCGDRALLGGLPNDRPVAVQLEGAGGEVLSSAGVGEVVERCLQGALERVHPGGPDVGTNWACPGTTTPGACNRSTPPAECPRRPW